MYNEIEIALLHSIASENQINVLVDIDVYCGVKFTGSTKRQVYNFINKWFSKLKLMKTLANEVKVPVYKATKTFYGNDIHGTWEEHYDLRHTPQGEIAEEKLKGDILRHRNNIDALTDFLINATTTEDFTK